MLGKSSQAGTTAMERLASGLRINTAKDDAAGLQISNKLTSQINGNSVAIRNANDGISMLQVAEGAQQEITNNLQRMRELAIQAANGTYSKSDRSALQEEFLEIKREIDRISDTTSFGSKRLFQEASGSLVDNTERDLVKGLQKTWLAESEQIILDEFGLMGKGSLKIDFEFVDGAGGAAAYVQSAYNAPTSEAIAQVMVIDLADYGSSSAIHKDDAGDLALDEVILHEMVHAVQAANFEEWANIPVWFKEGSAEVIRGADERVATDISNFGIDAIFTELDNNWEAATGAGPTTGIEIAAVYSGGYIALRYLNEELGGTGIKDLMGELAGGATFDAALSTVSSGTWANEAALFAEISGAASDPVTYNSVFAEFVGTKMDLTNLDNGALGGEDADEGTTRYNTMQGNGTGRSDGTKGFRETLILNDSNNTTTDFSATVNYDDPSGGEILLEDYKTEVSGAGGEYVTLQVGAKSQQTIGFTLGSFSSENLGLEFAEIVEAPQFAIFAIDDALTIVDKQRGLMGASMNRLEKTINNLTNINENITASRSRIRDTDFAKATAEMTKTQILQQASSSILAQANQLPQQALSLLS